MAKDIEFEFDIVGSLPKGTGDEDAIMDALFDAGYDDAVVGLGAAGLVGLGFMRAGEDAEVVISAAVKHVLCAFPEGAQLREVKPDLLSLADVSARLSVSSQALQKRDMPPPSLGVLYRASEMLPALEPQLGKVRDALEAARGWFASASAAQKINACASLGQSSLMNSRSNGSLPEPLELDDFQTQYSINDYNVLKGREVYFRT